MIRVCRPVSPDRSDGSRRDRRFQAVSAILPLRHRREETVFPRSSERACSWGRLASPCRRAQLADARIVASQSPIAIRLRASSLASCTFAGTGRRRHKPSPTFHNRVTTEPSPTGAVARLLHHSCPGSVPVSRSVSKGKQLLSNPDRIRLKRRRTQTHVRTTMAMAQALAFAAAAARRSAARVGAMVALGGATKAGAR